ncbi:hypothetical protein ACQPZF_06090 [Actinosynnema sp. CS-041913]|uniref:hypothetical protein n=1 Tax=Actinosynnema sp. CS-041913 TaxID=3239917 RepID=UPI003D90EE0E
MKAYMLGWVVAERPELSRVLTMTAADNVHMIRVNHALGYATVESMVGVAGSVDLLASRIGGTR